MKSASLTNILPYILLYVAMTADPKNKKDRLYDYIPDKSKDLKKFCCWFFKSLIAKNKQGE